MAQRRKLRALTALVMATALLLGLLATTASAGNNVPVNTNWGEDRTFVSRYEFELVCDEVGGRVGRYNVWDQDTLYCAKNPAPGSPRWWVVVPGFGLIEDHWFTYSGPDSGPDWNECPGCGGGGSW